MYKVSGTVKDKDGTAIQRKVHLLSREPVRVIDVTTSAPDGSFELLSTNNDPSIVLAVPLAGDNSNARVYDWVIPEEHVTPVVGVNDIGIPGTMGFGVGICPNPPAGFVGLPGFTDPLNDNYGNYQYEDGSIMCWIPAFWYKWGTGANGLALNEVSIKRFSEYEDEATANLDGHAIHRAFYDGGVIKPGFFIDKYHCSLHPDGDKPSSIKYANPLNTSATAPSINTLPGITAQYWGCVDAAKLRGSEFFCTFAYHFMALAMLSWAHGNAVTDTENCAWWGEFNNWPKGNNQTSRVDISDNSVIFYPGQYANQTKCGSGLTMDKTTHNGQQCGVADVNGNLWCVAPGVSSNGSVYFVLDKSAVAKDMTSGTASVTDLWYYGAGTKYINVGGTIGDLAAGYRWTYRRHDVQTYSEEVDSDSNQWYFTGSGLPSASGTLATVNPMVYGGGLYERRINLCCPLAGGAWNNGLDAGAWALYLNDARGTSNSRVGFRLSCF